MLCGSTTPPEVTNCTKYQKLGPELCLMHKTKLAEHTARGPTFQPVRGRLPENMYRDKDEEERKGAE